MPVITRGRSPRSIARPLRIALAVALAGPGAPRASADDAPRPSDQIVEGATALVDRIVDERLASLAEEIDELESSRPREPLLARRFTVETFLIAATLPLGLLRGVEESTPIDPCPLWRHDFRGSLPPLRVVPGVIAGDGLRAIAPRLAPASSAGDRPAAAIAGEFLVELRRGVDGDDPVAIGGLLLVAVERDGSRSLAILATRCEPCLSPGSVDFPIVPERFLLESDARETRIAVLEPEPLSHREARRSEPPRLDQPEDLYDLLDGVRPLVLGAAPEVDPPSPHDSPIAARGGVACSKDDVPRSASGVPTSTWESRDGADRLLQRVTLRRDGDDLAELLVEQPPVEVEWTSSEVYQLDGHRPDGSLDRRWLRPRGSVIAHRGGLVATFRFSGPPTGAVATVDAEVIRGEDRLATLRWSHLRAIDSKEVESTRGAWRRIFAPAIARPVEAERGPDEDRRATPRLPDASADRSLDPRAVERDAARRALRLALASRDAHVLRDATLRHRRAIEVDELSSSMTLRSLEGLAESLAAVGDRSSLERLLGAPWSDAVAAIPTPELARLVRERVAQGRWASSMLLASSLASRTDLPSVERETLDGLSSRLAVLIGDDPSSRPRPDWFVPPGRPALEAFIHERERRAPSASAPGSPTLATAPKERSR